MPLNIEDYALIGDCHTAAMVGRDGSIDWLCLPRFDSPSTFGALLGDERHGRWLLAPADRGATASRSYRGHTFVLDTEWETEDGAVRVTDFMPIGDRRADVIRRVTGLRGTVRMKQELVIRFAYATALPWVRKIRGDDGLVRLLAIAGPDSVVLRGGPMPRADQSGGFNRHIGEFTVAEGITVDIVLTWWPSHRPHPTVLDAQERLDATVNWWESWAGPNDPGQSDYAGHVLRSLLVLRALTHSETGGIVAAATTSLPEQFGGVRNWDYRFCWLRDASLTLEALLLHGYREEAKNWRSWLLRAIAGDPDDVQIMYGLAGERYLPERELDSLPGYRGASPVRVGNAAYCQYQADVLGEVLVSLEKARQCGESEDAFSWPLQKALLEYVEENWQRPDQGIWEIRGPERHFTHSRVMVWAALDRGVRAVRDHGLDGPADRWAKLRDRLREEIETKGWDDDRQTYVQHYGSQEVDASLLVLPQVGYCAPDDDRMLSTVSAIEKDLLKEGLLLRYRTESDVDGLPAGEFPFLACSFWLVEQYARSGREADAKELMDRLVTFCNDLGLLSEEYDVAGHRQVGNTPQAFSHLALVRAADAIDETKRGSLQR
jgi:GH15 family glucan-1,4-alpha-glucosidase